MEGPVAASGTPGTRARGLTIARALTRPGAHPYDLVEWERRDASIANEKGEIVFEQKGVEFPSFWSQMATNVAVSKYFHGPLGSPERERSLRTLISRVANTIADWGLSGGYFATPDDGECFRAELTHLLLHQHAAFNSPVWFNVGIEAKPQCSACFINSVADNMESILSLAKTEGMLFKWGSGTGTNLSPIRSSRERLSSGGTSSGPVSFMKGYDAFAGVIKSGGKTRRAAKMTILNIDHPDVVEFINCKADEEKKAWALIDAGYDGSLTGEAYSSVFFQNSNISVRVSDAFMEAVLADDAWTTRAVTTGEVVDTYRARDLMRMIAESAHLCGDPGMQFDTTINSWNTAAATARINATNPCSEYVFIDDTACNLASLNLLKFRKESGEFDVDLFRHACAVMITAQEILVDNASYPTPAIAVNSRDYRPLGLGYANLGALLMADGLPYDSDAGRATAAAITAIMTGQAYKTSAEIAGEIGPFPAYQKNREAMLAVMEKHAAATRAIDRKAAPCALVEAAETTWAECLALGARTGYRNAQATVLAPTGTIGFMMDCDTTGVEPDIALVKYKKLVGGGLLKIVNNTVPVALKRLGYGPHKIAEILEYVDAHETIEGAPGLADDHLPVFDCAFKPVHGVRSIHYMGHVKMMAAVQPFISGAISKTVNMPRETTPEEILETYAAAWKSGLKAVAIYRDGSKRIQPLNTGRERAGGAAKAARAEPPAAAGAVAAGGAAEGAGAARRAARRRLPDERRALTHKFSIGGHEGYITVGLYDDGRPGEIFITMSKEGSVVSGLMDGFATAISMALQYGVPLDVICAKFSHMRFEPSGFTNNREIPIAKSVLDYIFRWMHLKFPTDRGAAAESTGPIDAADGSVGARSDGNGHASISGGDGDGGGNGANGGRAARRTGRHDIWLEGAGARGERDVSAGKAPRLEERVGSQAGGVTIEALLSEIEAREKETFIRQADAPPCQECGSIMVRNGACYKCLNCGSVFGCS
jgi:ribonucleoside-diphosphate reductase alpha chain